MFSMEEIVGKIIHYYDKIGVAVVKLEGNLMVGDTIHVKGKQTDFEQQVESIQVEHESTSGGKKGEEVAVKLNEKAKEGDLVYKKT